MDFHSDYLVLQCGIAEALSLRPGHESVQQPGRKVLNAVANLGCMNVHDV